MVDAVEKKVPGQGYGCHNRTPRETHACFMPLDADAGTDKGRPGHAAREETGMVGCLGAGTGLYELPARATSEVRNEDFLAKAKWRRRIRQPFLFDIQLGHVRGTDDFPLGAEDGDQPIESPPAVFLDELVDWADAVGGAGRKGGSSSIARCASGRCGARRYCVRVPRESGESLQGSRGDAE